MTESTFSIMRLKRKGKDEDINISNKQIIMECESSKLKDDNKDKVGHCFEVVRIVNNGLVITFIINNLSINSHYLTFFHIYII